MGVTRITNKIPNRSAIEALEEALEKAKSGEIQAVAISGYLENGNLYQEISSCNPSASVHLYAAVIHTEKFLYNSIFRDDDYG